MARIMKRTVLPFLVKRAKSALPDFVSSSSRDSPLVSSPDNIPFSKIEAHLLIFEREFQPDI